METTPISPQMRLYYRRKEAGLCVNCGKILDTDGVKCKECCHKVNQGKRDTFNWYKDNGVCPICRKNNLFGDEKCALNVQQNAMPREFQDTMPIPKNSRKKIELSKKLSIREEVITDYAFIAVKLSQMRDIKRVLSAVTNLKSRNV